MSVHKVLFDDRIKPKNVLALNEKVAAIRCYEIDPVYKKVGRMFNCSPDQIKRIIKQKDEILAEWENRTRKPTAPTSHEIKTVKISVLGKAVHEWIRRIMYYTDFNLNDTLIQTMSLEFSKVLNLAKFYPNKEWIATFRATYNLPDANTKTMSIGYQESHSVQIRDILRYVKEVSGTNDVEVVDSGSEQITVVEEVVEDSKTDNNSNLCEDVIMKIEDDDSQPSCSSLPQTADVSVERSTPTTNAEIPMQIDSNVTNYRPVQIQQQTTNYRPVQVQPQTTNYQHLQIQPQTTKYQSVQIQPQTSNYQPVQMQPQSKNYQTVQIQPQTTDYRPIQMPPQATIYQSVHIPSESANYQHVQLMQPVATIYRPVQMQNQTINIQPLQIQPHTINIQPAQIHTQTIDYGHPQIQPKEKKLKLKPEAESEPEPKPKLESEPETKLESEPEPKLESEPEPKPESEREPEMDEIAIYSHEAAISCVKLLEDFALMKENFRLIGLIERLEEALNEKT